MKNKKIPIRKCIGCGISKPKNELIRLVKNKNEDKIFLDKTGKMNGRGAYICFDRNCLEKAKKSRALNRIFETEISKQTYDELLESIE